MNLKHHKEAKTLKANGRLINNLTMMGAFILLIVGVVSCGKSKYSFSSVHDGFDPESGFRQHGFTVNRETHSGSGVSNPVYGYAWTSWQGVLTTSGTNGCEAAANLLRDSLKTVNGSFGDELCSSDRSKGQPIVGMLMYNKDKMHGEIHIWLMPDATETTISYVIFLREEPLN
jgi:hypothetical protein